MPPHMAQLPSFAVPGAGADAPATSRAIVMLNMVTAEELFDDQDYEDIVEDIREECSKYGEVEDLEIPRPTKKEKKWAPGDVLAEKAREDARSDEERGVGRVYVLFKSISGAQAGVKAIAGRQFGGKTIICAASDEVRFVLSSFVLSSLLTTLSLSLPLWRAHRTSSWRARLLGRPLPLLLLLPPSRDFE